MDNTFIRTILRTLACVAMALFVSLPVLANPPDSGPDPAAPRVGQMATQEALQVQDDTQSDGIQRFQASKAKGFLASLFGLARHGLALMVLATHPEEAAAQGFSTQPTQFGTLPSFNLSALDPASAFAAQTVTQALARANGTGALPPLGDLNAMLGRLNPSGTSVLATLPEPPDMSDMSGVPGLPALLDLPSPSFPGLSYSDQLVGSDLLNPPAANVNSTAFRNEVTAAGAVLTVAQLTESYYMVSSIGLNFIADSFLVANVSALYNAFSFLGNELQSVGYAIAAAAAQVQVNEAQSAISMLQKQAQGGTSAGPNSTTQAGDRSPMTPATGTPSDGFLDPDLIYGTWYRLDFDMSGDKVIYKVARNGVVKTQTTTNEDGDTSVQTKGTPGAVMGYLSYTLPKGSTSPSDAVGRINLTITVEQSNGNSMSMHFFYIKSQSPGNSSQSLDVLVEQEGQKKAFIRISKA